MSVLSLNPEGPPVRPPVAMKRQPRRARRRVMLIKDAYLLLLFPSAGVKSPLTGYTCICVCLWLRQILSGTKDIQILTESEIFIRRIFCLSIRELFRDSRNEGWPETARRRTLRKHRHVTTSPAASLPVVARCTASCRPLPSPPARYAPAPSPHLLSAKNFIRALRDAANGSILPRRTGSENASTEGHASGDAASPAHDVHA